MPKYTSDEKNYVRSATCGYFGLLRKQAQNGFIITTAQLKDFKEYLKFGVIGKGTLVSVIQRNHDEWEAIRNGFSSMGFSPDRVLHGELDGDEGMKHLTGEKYDFANLDTCGQFTVPILYALYVGKFKRVALTVCSGRERKNRAIMRKLFCSPEATRNTMRVLENRRPQCGDDVLDDVISGAGGIFVALGAWPDKIIVYPGGDNEDGTTMITFLVTSKNKRKQGSPVLAACKAYHEQFKGKKAFIQNAEEELGLGSGEKAHATIKARSVLASANANNAVAAMENNKLTRVEAVLATLATEGSRLSLQQVAEGIRKFYSGNGKAGLEVAYASQDLFRAKGFGLVDRHGDGRVGTFSLTAKGLAELCRLKEQGLLAK